MAEETQLYTRKPQFIFRKVVDELILVPIHKDLADMDSIYSLNPVGAFIWEQLEQPATFMALETAVRSEFDTDHQDIAEDLKHFLTDLIELGAVTRV